MFASIRSLFSSAPQSSPAGMAEIRAFVDNAIATNRVAVFSKSYCPYCSKAKGLLKSKYGDVPTAVFELDERKDGSAIQDYLQQKTGQRTVPNIFIDTEHIGGSSDLVELQDKGKLATLLHKPAAPAL
ncbi:hypothetical protein M0805_002578 [Coniferiporia weirii]|nr:hypothetical protein M0805_002578 [Coniferiporia weirii]